MARLDPKPYPGPWAIDFAQSYCAVRAADSGADAALEALIKRSDALTGKDLVGAVVTFPRGDGMAVYIVTKATPLTVQHVPYCDAWTAPAEVAYLRADRIIREREAHRRWTRKAG